MTGGQDVEIPIFWLNNKLAYYKLSFSKVAYSNSPYYNVNVLKCPSGLDKDLAKH